MEFLWGIIRIAVFILIILALTLTALRFSKEKKNYLTHYLYFIRYPILFGLFIFIFPLWGISSNTENLFVLSQLNIGIVSLCAYLLALSIVFTGRLIWCSIPIRYGDQLPRAVENPEMPGELINAKVAFYTVGLILPLIYQLISYADMNNRLLAIPSAGIGVGVAYVMRSLSVKIADRFKKWMVNRKDNANHKKSGKTKFPEMIKKNVDALQKEELPYDKFNYLPLLPFYAYKVPKKYTHLREKYYRLHWGAFWFASLTIFFYLSLGLFTGPGWIINESFPALAYVILFMMLLVWIVGILSFQFDATRVPIIIILFILLYIWQVVWPSDYLFPVQYQGSAKTEANDAEKTSSRTVLDARADRQNVLIAITASGGGIRASLWTAVVLKGLEDYFKDFGFGEHVAFISSVSGGSVGSMLYVDQFTSDGPPSSDILDSIVVSGAGTSSLAAVTWGFVYPDLARLVLGESLGSFDRGRAQEKSWERHMTKPGQTLIGNWSAGVENTWRPLQIFNVTLEETGEQLLLSPVSLVMDPSSVFAQQDMFEFLPGKDISVATAARLSATFPYVSPRAKPDAGSAVLDSSAYHTLDGGYYDNSGIVSAMGVLKGWLETRSGGQIDSTRRPKIVLIEIRASDYLSDSAYKEPAEDTFVNSLASPLTALQSVRSTSQRKRNAFRIEMAEKNWREAYNVDFQHFAFQLDGSLPLSWHLTENERIRISYHWPENPLEAEEDSLAIQDYKNKELVERIRKKNKKQLNSLEKYLR